MIERAKAHFKQIGMRSIEVPEWPDDKGAPSVIYWTPMTLEESDKLLAVGEITLAAYADVIAAKAVDETGKKLFDAQGKIELKKAAERSVVTRIALAILSAPKIEDVEKN